MKKRIVGLGEILWDILPQRTCLGGAPANFAYITRLMDDEGVVASRVGEDARGVEALRRMRELGLDVEHVQTDGTCTTGTVKVEIDEGGLARYEIADPVAWDFLEWTEEWRKLAETADAVCFGSLAQRSESSRTTIRNFLRAAARAVRVFDVNLRQAYYSREVLDESMRLAHIVKLNDEELPKVMELMDLSCGDQLSSARKLMSVYELMLVCVTRGARGSLLVRANDVSEHSGFRVRVADTVGAGDAFTAGLVHEYLRSAGLDELNETANRLGAWVANEVGAMPAPKGGSLVASLAEIG